MQSTSGWTVVLISGRSVSQPVPATWLVAASGVEAGFGGEVLFGVSLARSPLARDDPVPGCEALGDVVEGRP